MRDVSFHKYSLYGNHFVLVDEIGQEPLGEHAKSQLAIRAADQYSGVGADSVIFLQDVSKQDLRRSRSVPLLAERHSHFIARFFEPTGEEFLTCANGLLSIAHHLFHFHGLAAAEILVEAPSPLPKVCSIGYSPETQISKVLLRTDPSRINDFVASSFGQDRENGYIFFADYSVKIGHEAICLSGLALYTGEPHLVIFQSPSGRPSGWPAQLRWAADGPDLISLTGSPLGETGLAAIGLQANQSEAFPRGINVNVARPLSDGSAIEYRCFERGVCRETLACGTGALAVGLAARRLDLVQGRRVRMLPRLGRSHPQYTNAEIILEEEAGSTVISGRADLLFSGSMCDRASSNDSILICDRILPLHR